MAPTISLVIPSYNRADLIAQTIDSALAQREPFHEIIVVDDGSTDHTASVLAAFGDRIKVMFLANGGVQHARNAGAAEASGDYITLCDSDDLLIPDFTETVMRWFRQYPDYDAFYSNFVTFNALGQDPDKFSGAPPGFFDGARCEGDYLHGIPDLYARTVSYQPLFMSGCVVSKALYRRLGGFDSRFNRVGGEDWEFTLRVLEAGKVVLCKRPLVRIRRHESNDSADSVHMERGTAQILEHALRHHPIAANFRDIIVKGIEQRRLGVFHVAFGRGDFPVAQEMLTLVRQRPTDLKFWMKMLITKLPPPVRQSLWKATQGAGR